MYKDEIIQEDLAKICEKYDFSALKKKKILVTGALGMLAYYYVATLLHLNDNYGYNMKVYVLARRGEKLKKEFGDREDVVIIVQDVCDEIKIADKVDIVLHAAGRADPETFKEDPVSVINANVIGTKRILDFARQKNAKVIFISTREVYGEVSTSAIKESEVGLLDQTELRSCYPESKRMAENLIICYHHQYGINYQIARLAHAYGPTMKVQGDGRVMADLIGRAIRREPIVLKSNGEAKRAFCYVVDAVAALLLITISKQDNEIYNVANETEEISIRSLAEKLAEWYDLKVEIKIENNDGAYVKFARTKLDTSKIEELGWYPLVKLEDGVKRTVEFFRKNETK